MHSLPTITIRRTATAISTLLLALGLVACGGNDSDVPTSRDGESAEQSAMPGSGSMEAGDDSGGDGGMELDDEFPDDIPMPADYAIVTQGFRGDGATVVYTTSTDFETLFDLYARGLPANGWDAGAYDYGIPDDPSPVRTVFDLTKDGYRLEVRITEEAEGFSVLINNVKQ